MSAATLSGLEPIAAAAAGGGEPIAATAAGERVQQLQTLLEQVEQGPSVGMGGASKTFASALGCRPSRQPYDGRLRLRHTSDAGPGEHHGRVHARGSEHRDRGRRGPRMRR